MSMILGVLLSITLDLVLMLRNRLLVFFPKFFDPTHHPFSVQTAGWFGKFLPQLSLSDAQILLEPS